MKIGTNALTRASWKSSAASCTRARITTGDASGWRVRMRATTGSNDVDGKNSIGSTRAPSIPDLAAPARFH